MTLEIYMAVLLLAFIFIGWLVSKDEAERSCMEVFFILAIVNLVFALLLLL